MAIAVFDYAMWTTRYPEFGAVSEQQAALFFAEAGLYLDNTDASLVADVNVRLMLLNMLTAHIASMSGAADGGAAGGGSSGVFGRVGSATEGGVSVSFDTGISAGTAEWYSMTSYGLAFWKATAGLRSATYVPAPPRIFDPWRTMQWRR